MTVYERDEGVGGLLRFGVPDAKLEKSIIDRRVKLLEEEGVDLRVRRRRRRRRQRRRAARRTTTPSSSRSARACTATSRCRAASSAACTSRWSTSTSATARWPAAEARRPRRRPAASISAEGKRVVVVGGGDTGMDCISNALREGAAGRDAARRLPGAARRAAARPHALAAAAEAHDHHLRARRGRRAALRHAGHRLRGRRTAWRGVVGRRVEGAPRATCAPSRAASSRSPPTSC